MSTHAAALGIAALAYRFARKHARDPHFSFGTGKLGELAAFSSAVLLALIALLIAYESLVRLYSPVSIRFDEATLIAVVGLGVNLLSAWLLFERDHPHEHHHDRGADRHHHDDTNIRAAYSHVMADALTSVLAIVALLGGRFMGWVWLDPVIGVVGAIVIARWSWGLIRDSGAVLLRHGARRNAGEHNPREVRAGRRPGDRPAPVAGRVGAQRLDRRNRRRPPTIAESLHGARCPTRRPVAHHHRGASVPRR